MVTQTLDFAGLKAVVNAIICCSTDSVAPMVVFCPDDVIVVDAPYPDAYASWSDPVFTGGVVSITASHQPGQCRRLFF